MKKPVSKNKTERSAAAKEANKEDKVLEWWA